MTSLKKQMEAYERMRNDIELEPFGAWVVLYDEELIGTYESFERAAEDAVRRFGRGPYLIRRIGASPHLTLPASVQYRLAG